MQRIPSQNRAAGLVGWLAVTFAAAVIGSLASINAGSFYAQLRLPGWAPPSSWFGPVWTILYIMMAIAAWLVWLEGDFQETRGTLILYVIQLVPNALWSWLFFRLRSGLFSFADILLLWILVTMTVFAFFRARALAGLLLVPYLLWVSFATSLNFSIWIMNRGILG